jgi:hypothetical protein
MPRIVIISVALSPKANYTDRGPPRTAKLVPKFVGRGCYVVSAEDPSSR